MSDALMSALVMFSTGGLLIMLVWADSRYKKAVDRAWREGLPGPRYGVRRRGTSLIHLGRPPMTFAEALRYCDTHEGYEVVIRDVVHTPWETYIERTDRLYRDKPQPTARDLADAAGRAKDAGELRLGR